MVDQSTWGRSRADIRVLGEITIRTDPELPAEPVPGCSALLLAALVAGRDQGVHIEELGELYWHATRPDHWRGLLEMYRHRLGELLPAGWQIVADDTTMRLVGERGSVDAWEVLDSAPGALVPECLLRQPYPGIERTGTVERSATAICDRQAELGVDDENDCRAPLATTVCQHDQTAFTDILGALGATTTIVHVGDFDAEVDALRESLAVQDHPADTVAIGGAGPALDFGDLAVATPNLRWPLLEIDASNLQAQVARAWRVVKDHVQASSHDRPRRLLVFDAHLMDSASLLLVTKLAAFPVDVACHVFGDADHGRDDWQRAWSELQGVAERSIERCDGCGQWVARNP